jgi:hypothetical protein
VNRARLKRENARGSGKSFADFIRLDAKFFLAIQITGR